MAYRINNDLAVCAVLLDTDEQIAFHEKCESIGKTMSDVLREFIAKFMEIP